MKTILFSLEENTYEMVRQVLERVPAYRPRATLQAYNAFLQRWLIVRLQKSENIFSPDLLALLLLIQYVWPDMFSQISANPYYFFFIHALVTGRDNAVCTYSLISEVKDLGLPENEKTKFLYPYDDPNLFRLLEVFDFGTVQLPDFLETEEALLHTMWSHITLDPALFQQPVFIELREQVWETLNSGDPARIKLLRFYFSETLSRDYEQPLLESVLDINKEIVRIGDKIQELVKEAETRVFALGFIGSMEETVDVLKQSLCSRPALPTKLRLRIIYAIERIMERIGNQHELISALVQDLLLNEQELQEQGNHVRVRVAKLSQYGIFSDEEVSKIIGLFYKDAKENSLVKLALRESWSKSSWHRSAWELLVNDLDKLQPVEVVKICEAVSWPFTLGRYFVKLAQQENSDLDFRAFTILRDYPNSLDGLQTHEDKENIIRWLSELIQGSEKFRKESWTYLTTLQSDKDVVWLTQTWKELKEYAIRNNDISIVHVLRDIPCSEARQMLETLVKGSPPDWLNIIEDALL